MTRFVNILTWRLSLIEAAFFLCWARLIIVALPYNIWSRLFNTITQDTTKCESANDTIPDSLRKPRRLAGAVKRAAPIMPFAAVCLPQAITLFWMLKWRGYRGMKIHYGTRISENQEFEAHAWLTLDDIILIGWHDDRFHPLAFLS